MKRTFNANISGIVFHIDEDAFEQLNAYLENLKKHFETTEGADEIISDIESRLAEILQEKLGPSKQVVSLADVEEAIKMLGQPFEMESDQDQDEPKKDSFKINPKRLFRNPDSRLVAGVASGLAAYFGIDALITRILFVVLTFVSGLGILLYIVMWIVVPEAKSTSEKLQMHGKPVDINNIEESVKKEFETVKTKLEGLADEARTSYHNQRQHIHKASNSVLDVLVRIAMVFARIMGIIVGLFMLIIGIALALAFGAFVLGWDGFSFIDSGQFIHFSLSTVAEWMLASPLAVSMAPVVLILFFGIPLVLLINGALRLLFGENLRIPYIGKSLGMLWLASLLGIILIIFDTVSDFRHQLVSSPDVMKILPPEGKPVYFLAETNQIKSAKPQVEYFGQAYFVENIGRDAFLHAFPSIEILPTTMPMLDIWAEGRASGASIEKAIERAESIHYHFRYSGDTLTLPQSFHFSGDDKLRRQSVKVSIRVPEGQVIYFDKSMKKLLSMNRHLSRRLPGTLEGNYWIMTTSGLQPYLNGSQD